MILKILAALTALSLVLTVAAKVTEPQPTPEPAVMVDAPAGYPAPPVIAAPEAYPAPVITTLALPTVTPAPANWGARSLLTAPAPLGVDGP